MILILGPAGSGKSLQGQILAARHGWKWISVGKMLRQKVALAHDLAMQHLLDEGHYLPAELTYPAVAQRLDQEASLDRVILDGFPRFLAQAEMLVNYLKQRGNGSIELAIILEIGQEESLARMAKRGRSDDNPEAISRRLDYFTRDGQEILGYLTKQAVRIERVDANGTVGQVHDQIEDVVETI